MAKQCYKLDQFHGGINSNSDARDINDHEFTQLRDVMVDRVGKIRPMGGSVTHDAPSLTTSNFNLRYGYGLLAFSSDWQGAGVGVGINILNDSDIDFDDGNWTVDNLGDNYGFTLGGDNVTYSAQTSGKIYQTSANRSSVGAGGISYSFTYTISSYSLGSGSPVLKILGGNGEFASIDTTLALSNGTHTKTFTSHANASTAKFSIQAESGQMNFILDNLSLSPNGNGFSNSKHDYLMMYRGNSQGDKLAIYSYQDDAWYGYTNLNIDNYNDGHPVFTIVDGVIRISDAKKEAQSPLKWYGFLNQKRFNSSVTTCKGWFLADAHLAKPTNTNIVLSGTGSTYSPQEGKIEFASDYGFTSYVDNSGSWNKNGVSGTSASSGNGSKKLVASSAIFTENMVGLFITMGSDTSQITGYESTTILYTEDQTWSNGQSFNIYEKYDLGVNWVYNKNQESLIHNRTTIAEPTIQGFSFHCPDIAAGHEWDTATTARITGFNLYYKKNSDSNNTWYHLLEVDLNKGLKKSGENEFSITWTQIVSRTEYHLQNITIDTPPELETFETRNGYKNDDNNIFNMSNEDGEGVGYSAAVVTNRTMYIGNIKYTDNDGVTKTHGDLMLKSMPNKFDTFLLDRKIEVTIQDGDEIVALKSYADRLLQFKKNKLHIINISQEIEFLEETFMYKGIKNPYAVCETDYGIAWVNEFGCYLYNGKEVLNLLESNSYKKIDTDNSSLTTSDGWISSTQNPMIGYLPKKRQLIVAVNISGAVGGNSCYIYDIITKGWTFGYQKILNSSSTAGLSNFTNDVNGDLVYAIETGDIYKWDDNSKLSTNFILKTKDIDFGNPAVRKRIYKVRISYKGDADSLVVGYYVNGDTDTINDFEGTDSTTGKPSGTRDTTPLHDKTDITVWHHAELKPDISSEANNIYSFKFYLYGTVDSDFQINDISIIYREKTVK